MYMSIRYIDALTLIFADINYVRRVIECSIGNPFRFTLPNLLLLRSKLINPEGKYLKSKT